jgi:hypothetical protein
MSVLAHGAAPSAWPSALAALFIHVPPLLRVVVLFAILIPLLIGLRPPELSAVERLIRSRWAAPLLGVVSACAMAFVWVTLRHPPIVQDEAAYLLQAHLFAAGRWADPAPPVPIFFEQPHVLVTPKLAAKYFPGHALLLTPGVWLHQPGLMPVLLLGLTGALVFALARAVLPRNVAPWAAVLAWLGWLGMVGHEGWPRPSYMSEITTAALWVFGWWSLLKWRDRRRPMYLLLLAVCVAWGAITRPLTMLAYAIPVAVVVLVLVWKRRAWRQLLVPGAAAVAVFALIPLWSWRTTGDWRTTPLALYTRQYLPWDVPGLGFRADAPTRAVPAEIACFTNMFGNPRRGYTVRGLPHAFLTRAETVAIDSFTDWRASAAPFAVLALFAMPVELAFAVGTCVVLLLSYLAYAHDQGYTLYYMETQTTVAVLAAFGLTVVPDAIARWYARIRKWDSAGLAGRPVVAWCAVVLCVLAVMPTVTTLRGLRRGREIGDLPHQMFRDTVASLSDQRSIVFVHFRPGEGCGQNLIENTPPLRTARAWVVYDRGAEDAQLIKMAPDRVPYRFDTHTWLRERITVDSVGVDSTVRPQQLSRPSSKGALEHARPASGPE